MTRDPYPFGDQATSASPTRPRLNKAGGEPRLVLRGGAQLWVLEVMAAILFVVLLLASKYAEEPTGYRIGACAVILGGAALEIFVLRRRRGRKR